MMAREKLAGRKYALMGAVAAKHHPAGSPAAPKWKESLLANAIAVGFDPGLELWARLACVEAIGSLGESGIEFASALGSMQKDSDLRIREAVRVALEGMGEEGGYQLMRQSMGLKRLVEIQSCIQKGAVQEMGVGNWKHNRLEWVLAEVGGTSLTIDYYHIWTYNPRFYSP